MIPRNAGNLSMPGVYRSRLVCFVLALTVAHALPSSAQTQSREACRFSVPAEWQQSASRWDGDCRQGVAQGLGVLKEYRGAEVMRLAYGRFDKGELQLGVIEEDGSLLAGRFQRGQVVPSEQRQVLIDALAEAAKAADHVAARYVEQGNAASARYYRQKAAVWRTQMD